MYKHAVVLSSGPIFQGICLKTVPFHGGSIGPFFPHETSIFITVIVWMLQIMSLFIGIVCNASPKMPVKQVFSKRAFGDVDFFQKTVLPERTSR